MTTLLLTHPASLGHDMRAGHPERPDRIRSIESSLAAEAFRKLAREQAPLGSREAILRVHAEDYVDAIFAAAPSEGLAQLDPDTAMGPGTLAASLHAVGAACRAVDAVMSGTVGNCFAALRPPGHHAERARAMGFCFFDNAAIAARHAQAAHSAERVAIVDFDVHHGNGTQDIFWSDPSVLYCSTHQMPLYPGHRRVISETGEHGNDRQRAARAPATEAKLFERRSGNGSCRGSMLSLPTSLSYPPASMHIDAIRSPICNWSKTILTG